MRILVLLLVLLSACSSPSSGPPDVPEPGPAEAYCAAYARSACARLAACGLVSEESMATCRISEAGACEWELGRFVRGGAVALSAEASQICSERLEAIGCVFIESADSRSVCFHDGAIRTPNAQLGERCHTTADCVQGQCTHESALGCGVCTSYPAQGSACGVCDPASQYCDGDADAGNGTCRQQLADGETCQIDAHCQSGVCNSAGTCGPAARGSGCSGPDECAEADFCHGQCRERLPEGGDCLYFTNSDPWSGCRKDLRCVDGSCAAALSRSVPTSGTCVSSEDCVSGICMRYNASAAGTCVAQPGPGAACTGYPRLCAEGETCSYQPDPQADHTSYQLMCAPPAAEGEACRRDGYAGSSGCMVGLRCAYGSFSATICMLPGDLGSYCYADSDCLSRRCDGGRCIIPGGSGAACSTDRGCVDRCVVSEGEATGICSAACFPAAR